MTGQFHRLSWVNSGHPTIRVNTSYLDDYRPIVLKTQQRLPNRNTFFCSWSSSVSWLGKQMMRRAVYSWSTSRCSRPPRGCLAVVFPGSPDTSTRALLPPWTPVLPAASAQPPGCYTDRGLEGWRRVTTVLTCCSLCDIRGWSTSGVHCWSIRHQAVEFTSVLALGR